MCRATLAGQGLRPVLVARTVRPLQPGTRGHIACLACRMVVLCTVVLAIAACGSPTDANGPPVLPGTTWILRAVNDKPLPVRFEPLDDSGIVSNARLDTGLVFFLGKGRMTGAWAGVGDGGVLAEFDFNVAYEQDGNRVVLAMYGDDAPPDTGIVSARQLTVRARFFRRLPDSTVEWYVIPMTYERR